MRQFYIKNARIGYLNKGFFSLFVVIGWVRVEKAYICIIIKLIKNIWGNNMSALKIVRLLSIAVAVVGAFIVIPEAALVMAVLGLVGGYMADEADKTNRTYFLVFAVALGTVSGAAAALPVIGGPISDIMANLSTIVNAAALAVILNAIKDRASE